MKQTIHQNDVSALERHRAEAKKYRQQIQDGTDAYTSNAFDWCVGALAAFVICYVIADAVWGPF